MKISDILCLMQLFIVQLRSIVEAQEYNPPSADFDRHSIVRPVLLHKRTKREIATTRDMSGLHHLEVTLKIPIEAEEYIVDLRLNQHLVPDNHVLSYQENGTTVLHKPTKEELDLCHYGGSVRGRPSSWVAVSTCHGVQGIVFDGERMRYIEPVQGGDVNTDHYIYDHLDLTKTHPHEYGNDATNITQHNYEKHPYRTTRQKRRAFRKAPFETHQPNERSLYVELVLVADKKSFEERHGRNRQSIHRELKTLANIINSVYSQLNIFIVLVGVEIWEDRDEIYFNEDSKSILEDFLQYRRTKLVREIPNDNAHLLTLQPFDETVVGTAYTGKMCTLQSSGGIAHYHTKVTGLQAMTIAHEMGHNFGMEHDTDDCECPDRACIMGYTSTEYFIPSHWSSCSLNSLAYYFSKGIDNCLRNKPESSSHKYSTCGNGMVERGEECDCGSKGTNGAYNPCHACCDPDTCRLRANAMCAAGSCCDIQTCRPMSAGTLCRAAGRECGLPEYCSGHSAHCPEDVHKMDTTPCGTGELNAYCVEGRCRSHTSQCRVLWGSTGKSCAEQVYHYNTAGDRSGDCGYDSSEGRYMKCANPDVMCGRLHCEHLSESSSNVNHLEIGTLHTIHNMAAQTPNRTATCYTVSVDLGLDVVDFGLVPDGAKCGNGMMCVKQRCVPVAAVRKRAEEILRRRGEIEIHPYPPKKETYPSPPRKETHPSPPKKETYPYPPKKETYPYPPKKETYPYPPKKETYPSPPREETYPYPPRKETHPSPPKEETHPSPPRKETYPYPPRKETYPSPPNKETYPYPPKKETYPYPPKKETYPSPPREETYPYPPRKESHPSPPKKETYPYPPKKETYPSPPREETYPYPPRKETHPSPPKKETHPYPPRKETHPYPPRKETHPYPPNGACNSKGHCLCEPGFTPPFCTKPGPGVIHGSEPATDSSSSETFKLVMYVIFLGIVPAILLVLLIIFCRRKNLLEGLQEYKQILRFKSKATVSISKITARKFSVIYANITTEQRSPGHGVTAVDQGSPIQTSNTAFKSPPIEANTAFVKESPIYTNTAAVCSSSTIHANLEGNTPKAQNWPIKSPTLDLKGIGKGIDKVLNEVRRRPTPNMVNLPREIRPNDKEVNSEPKIRTLVKLKPILKNQSEEIRSNVYVAKSEIGIRPLVKKSNLNNWPEENRPNVRALKAMLESKNQTSG